MKQTIMVIDDDKSNLTAAKLLLEDKYEVSLVNSGMKALKLLDKYKPDLVLLDLKMPDMDGFEVIDIMKNNEKLKNIPVIILTADKSDETERDCFIHGAMDYIGKPLKATVMLERVRRSLELDALRNELEQKVQEKVKEVESIVLQTIIAVANTVDARAEYTTGHSVRVAEYSLMIAQKLGWGETQKRLLHQTALLHDIGKIGIPDSILNKSDRLTGSELEIVRNHSNMGAEILKDIKSMKDLSINVRFHHERYDGQGYPSGISGDDIPIFSRIIAVADAYEAMTSDRVYRNRLSDEKIISEFTRERGHQFDPQIVDILLELIAEHGRLRNLLSGREGETFSSGALVQRVLEKQSETDRNEATVDWLTGLASRSFTEREMVKRLREENGYFVLIDLDNFKTINDFYGHAAGDAVLQTVAEIIKSILGEKDFASRVGGDEFTIYFGGLEDKEEAGKYCQKIQDIFQEKKKQDMMLSECSLSMGVVFSQKGVNSYREVYQRADRALYYVKQNGKNNFEFYNESQEEAAEQESSGIAELQRFVKLLDMEKEKKGVYEIGYREMSRTLKLVSRFVERNNQNLQLILFTLQPGHAHVDLERQQKTMEMLEEIIYHSLRKVDISTRYSSSQYMVVLVDTDEAGIQIVSNRIIKEFQSCALKDDYELVYDFVELDHKEEFVKVEKK